MIVKIFPSNIQGKVHIPSSKSYGHRAIICACLAKGSSTINNVQYSDDIVATIEAMRALGAIIEEKGNALVIQGISTIASKYNAIDCKESGSTLRFLLPLFSLTNQKITFTGQNRLLKRPYHIYEEIFRHQELKFHQKEDALTIHGALQAGNYCVPGNISSQFITGLLMTLPLLKGDSYLEVLEPFESKSYVEMTIGTLQEFGIEIIEKEKNCYYIAGNQEYQPLNYSVEGDYSQFAFFAVLAALKQPLNIVGVPHCSLQGDQAILNILKEFGATIETMAEGYRISPNKRNPLVVDLQNCPDLGPIVCVLLSQVHQSSKLTNIKRLQFKESNRMKAMQEELEKVGVQILLDENEAIITNSKKEIKSVKFNSHQDHRIVMALAVLIVILNIEGEIHGAEAIQKSYPSFFTDLRNLGLTIECIQ